MLWKQQYHRQWPVMFRYLDPQKDVDWKACFCLRYGQEREKRLATKGKQKVTLNFFKYREIEEIVKRIAVVGQQIDFEGTLDSSKEKVLKSLENKEELAAEFSRWMDLFLEGTSFSDWESFSSRDPDITRKEGTWMLFLPTRLEGLTFQLDATRKLHHSGAAYDSSIILSIHERTSKTAFAEAYEDGDEFHMNHKLLLSKLLKADAALRQTVTEAKDEVWKAFPWAFMAYLCACTDEFVEEEGEISYSKEKLLAG